MTTDLKAATTEVESRLKTDVQFKTLFWTNSREALATYKLTQEENEALVGHFVILAQKEMKKRPTFVVAAGYDWCWYLCENS